MIDVFGRDFQQVVVRSRDRDTLDDPGCLPDRIDKRIGVSFRALVQVDLHIRHYFQAQFAMIQEYGITRDHTI